ncbi:Glutathione S-transferase 2 [Serendipita sp. 401]|nr:Glutathione S-transferase 2 [Serendipita sp. 401]KAG9052565.1 Glutathione S-transferase 2 [Serendipita sp. 407]
MSAPQLTLYLAESGLNWMKLLVLMEELGVSYNEVILDFAKEEQKTEEYRKLNPNGRIPTLVDHSNNDEVIWESNAILKYLADRYDTEKKLTVTDEKEKADLDTWLFYQASHQGPTFGNCQWFMFYHPERIPSAILRFQNEIKRIFGVLNDVLSKKEWLVGNKCTIADLAFIKYNDYAIHHLLPTNFNVEREFPHLAAWHAKLMARPAVQYAINHMLELDVGRERQHVNGVTHSEFARTATGIARRGIAAQAAKDEILVNV